MQFESVLKGHGFSPAVSRIFIAALAAEGRQFPNCTTTRWPLAAAHDPIFAVGEISLCLVLLGRGTSGEFPEKAEQGGGGFLVGEVF